MRQKFHKVGVEGATITPQKRAFLLISSRDGLVREKVEFLSNMLQLMISNNYRYINYYKSIFDKKKCDMQHNKKWFFRFNIEIIFSIYMYHIHTQTFFIYFFFLNVNEKNST